MVVSNNTCKERNRFFEKLSQYKRVDSGGRYLNNVGGAVKDKMGFIKDYKFVFAFENSCYAGYTTEKIVEPMVVNSLPIYWGNPEIDRDFNTASFINVHDYSSFEEAINAIIEIDKNEVLYRKYLQEPFFKENRFPNELEFEEIGKRLHEAVEQLLRAQPVSQRAFYKQEMRLNKMKRKLYSRIHKRPHFYF